MLLCLVSVLAAIMLPASALAGIGSQISQAIALDTARPQLAVDQIAEHTAFFTDQTIDFHWTSSDDNPGSTPDQFQASVIIDSETVETITWYPDITDFTWDYTIPAIQSGNCYVEVVATDSFGNTTVSSSGVFTILLSTSEVPAAPTALTLGSPTPNPFNPATTVFFSVPAGSKISLSVYDVRGRMVRNLINGSNGSGTFSARWDGLNDSGQPQSGGVYFFVLDAKLKNGQQRLTRKAMLVP